MERWTRAVQVLCGASLAMLALGASPLPPDVPWRGLAPTQASKISWSGILGSLPGDAKRSYVIAAREWLSLPFLGGPGMAPEADEFIAKWLRAHPDALAIPVEASPFLRDTANVYVWIVAGKAQLNVELVERGYCRARLMVPILRPEDRLVGADRVDPFLRKIAEAEKRAATAHRGLWKTATDDQRADAGNLPSGLEVLAEIVAESEAAEPYVPPPVYDATAPEVDLIRIADDVDPGASYAALSELVRRALGGRLSHGGLEAVIATGLDRQGKPGPGWRAFYGSLIDVAFSQHMLSAEQVERYATQSLVLQVRAELAKEEFWSKDDRPLPVILGLEGEFRGACFRGFEGDPRPALPLTARVVLSTVAIDGTPVEIRLYDVAKAEIVTRYDLGIASSGGTNVRLVPPRALAPGAHEVTGRVLVEIRKGGVLTRPDGDDLAVPLNRRTVEFHAPFNVGH